MKKCPECGEMAVEDGYCDECGWEDEEEEDDDATEDEGQALR